MRNEEEVRRMLDEAYKMAEKVYEEPYVVDPDYYMGIIDALKWVLGELDKLWEAEEK